MKVTVLQVQRQGRVNVAHVRLPQAHADLFGEMLAADDVKEPGVYDLRVVFRKEAGRIVPLARVEKS